MTPPAVGQDTNKTDVLSSQDRDLDGCERSVKDSGDSLIDETLQNDTSSDKLS